RRHLRARRPAGPAGRRRGAAEPTGLPPRRRTGPAARQLPPALLRPRGRAHARARVPAAGGRDPARRRRRPAPRHPRRRPGEGPLERHEPRAPCAHRARPDAWLRPRPAERRGGAARLRGGVEVVHPHEPWWIAVIEVLVIVNLVMVAFAYTT